MCDFFAVICTRSLSLISAKRFEFLTNSHTNRLNVKLVSFGPFQPCLHCTDAL